MGEENTSVLMIPDLIGKTRRQSAYLIVITARSAAGVGVMLKLEHPEIILGRSADAHLQITDEGISRRHAKVLRLPDETYQLVDMGSTNGTYLNGERVRLADLKDGDKIQIGSNTVLKFSIQDEIEEQFQRSIYESATRDGLTRVLNKKYFVDALAKEFAYSARHHTSLAVAMMDVDHFKQINDTYGHPAGDLVLQGIAQRLSEMVRAEDVFARFGGEEFALLMREISEDQAVACAER
jgi:GGDEF domain-containing protein